MGWGWDHPSCVRAKGRVRSKVRVGVRVWVGVRFRVRVRTIPPVLAMVRSETANHVARFSA